MHKLPALLAASAMLWVSPASAQMFADSGEYWHDGWTWGWGHMFVGSLMMVIFWAVIIAAILLILRWLVGDSRRSDRHVAPRNNALEILRERFARGEIDKEEYEERRHLLAE